MGGLLKIDLPDDFEFIYQLFFFFSNRFSLQIQYALTSTTVAVLFSEKFDQVRSYIVFYWAGRSYLIYCKRFIVATLVTSRTADSHKLCYLGCSLHSGGLVSGPFDTKSYPGVV